MTDQAETPKILGQTAIKHKINARDYLFLCQNDSPLGEVYDVLKAMCQGIVNQINSRQKEPEKKNEGEKPPEE